MQVVVSKKRSVMQQLNTWGRVDSAAPFNILKYIGAYQRKWTISYIDPHEIVGPFQGTTFYRMPKFAIHHTNYNNLP